MPGPVASFKLQQAKLHPPPARPGIVPRTTLVDRLLGARAPLVYVVAPPGYGKTTRLAQWAAREPRPVVWVTVDRHDYDPAVFAALASPGPAAARSGLVAAAKAMDDPVCLVLDHVELLTNRQCLDEVAESPCTSRRGRG